VERETNALTSTLEILASPLRRFFSSVTDWFFPSALAVDGLDIGNFVAFWGGESYERIGMCTGFVIEIYMLAGIDLEAIARSVGMKDPNMKWVPNMHKLASMLTVGGKPALRESNDPLVGDIVFFKHTFDPLKTCTLVGNPQPTHVGVIIWVDPSNSARVKYAHASFTRGVVPRNENELGDRMARDVPDDRDLNSELVVPRKCVPCDSKILFYGAWKALGFYFQAPDCPVDQCSSVSRPNCAQSDFPFTEIVNGRPKTVGPRGVTAAELFYGYATIRPVGQ
jgi:hypothetical protein